MIHRLLALIAFALIATGATTEDEALRRAVERGRLIYEFDQAAWISTDELRRQVPDLSAVRGWVVEPKDGAYRAIYFALGKSGPQALFTADVRDHAVVASQVFPPGEDATLSPLELRMIQARAIASTIPHPKCVNAPSNTVVLPPGSLDGPIPVYILTPQVTTGEYPFGGHFEVDVSSDGKVVTSRPFTKACLPMTLPPNTAGAFITHLLDPTPTEIHVYLSLWMGKPIYVMTQNPKRVWSVDGDKIKLVPDGAIK